VVPGQKLESDDISLVCCNIVRSESQRSILSDLDGDIRGADASGETQKSGNEGGEMHVSDKIRER